MLKPHQNTLNPFPRHVLPLDRLAEHRQRGSDGQGGPAGPRRQVR